MEQHPQRIGAAGNQKDSVMSDVRPRLAIDVVAVWALIQTTRIAAIPLAQGVLTGSDPAAWLFPAFGDIFIGITAPFVAFAIWRRTGLAVWVTAIVWFALSISDHLDALTTALAGPLPINTPGFSSQSGTVAGFLVATALDVIALALLTRGKMKSHYFGSLRPAEQ